MTDEYTAYNGMKAIIKHEQINHTYEYVNGNIHTNTIESFWALLKRGIIGQFHKVSKHYLQNYLGEFEYRYNRRKFTGTKPLPAEAGRFGNLDWKSESI